MTEQSIQVFQDLHLRALSADVSIRERILSHIQAPWRHDPDRERNVRGYASTQEDVIALIREPFEGIDEVALVLWQEEYGYRVANIVPRKAGELGIAKYNEVLQHFVTQVARPAAQLGGFAVDLTVAKQTVDDWLEAVPAASLRRFSGAANKSTGASHPKDQERWYDFLIDAHRTAARLGADQLVRWLVEVEDWPSETAHELAIEYEFARGLLQKYDGLRT